MQKQITGLIIFFTITACSDQNSSNTDNNVQQKESITWESKFPSLWSVAYASDVIPENVTYEQFVDAVSEKLKSDIEFKNNVKGDAGEQGVAGPVGPQGTEGAAGQDGVDGINGTDAALPTWETMYTFGNGDTFFYTCNSNSPCTADDIDYHQVYVNDTTNPYFRASLSAGTFVGTDLLNTGAAMTNLRASHNCEYKAEILTVDSNVNNVLTPSSMGSGRVTFNIKGPFTGQFDIIIGDASASGPRPNLYVGKTLPYSFAATQSEKDRIAHEFNNVGTSLFFKVVLKRRCSQP